MNNADDPAPEPQPASSPSEAAGSEASSSEASLSGSTPSVVALSVDLMDRSKISAAFPHATLVRSVAKLIEVATAEKMLLVDLARVDDASVLQDLDARVIAFGSHVNEEQLAAAQAVGVEALPRSVFFRRLEHGEF